MPSFSTILPTQLYRKKRTMNQNEFLQFTHELSRDLEGIDDIQALEIAESVIRDRPDVAKIIRQLYDVSPGQEAEILANRL